MCLHMLAILAYQGDIKKFIKCHDNNGSKNYFPRDNISLMCPLLARSLKTKSYWLLYYLYLIYIECFLKIHSYSFVSNLVKADGWGGVARNVLLLWKYFKKHLFLIQTLNCSFLVLKKS